MKLEKELLEREFRTIITEKQLLEVVQIEDEFQEELIIDPLVEILEPLLKKYQRSFSRKLQRYVSEEETTKILANYADQIGHTLTEILKGH